MDNTDYTENTDTKDDTDSIGLMGILCKTFMSDWDSCKIFLSHLGVR